MINWKVLNSNTESSDWNFPSFEIQEYLLPLINVGGAIFDEYAQTKYTAEDCLRLRNTVRFASETLTLMNKPVVRYETIHNGLVSLDKTQILYTLTALDKAAEHALVNESSLIFFGD